jgi:polar amino acid transport system ATP-binding protein
MANPILRLSGLQKSFDENMVFSDIDLDVYPGDRISILGASGSGKSTLLRCINLLEIPDEGQIEIGGKLIGDPSRKGPGRYPERELRALRQRVGMVFQHFNLFPHMTTLGNVAEGLVTVRGMKASDALERALTQLRRVGLEDKAETYPSRLSGGQKQRVAIARALAMEPEILLFDEPTSALDPALVGEVLGVIEQLANEGRTMLLVTHEIGFAYHVSSRVIFLGEGGIYEMGTPDEVLKAPKRPLTQQFLGEHKRFQF